MLCVDEREVNVGTETAPLMVKRACVRPGREWRPRHAHPVSLALDATSLCDPPSLLCCGCQAQGKPGERYLLATDVVKGSGFPANTSASNIVDRWFREADAKAHFCGLPSPAVPARFAATAGHPLELCRLCNASSTECMVLAAA